MPDFTVYPVSDLLYLYITRAQYVAAFRASVVERSTVTKIEGITIKEDGTLSALERQAVDWQRALQLKRGSLALLPDAAKGADAAAAAATAAAAFKKTSLMANSNVSLHNVQKAKSADALLSTNLVEHNHADHQEKTPYVHSSILQRQDSSRRTSREEHVP